MITHPTPPRPLLRRLGTALWFALRLVRIAFAALSPLMAAAAGAQSDGGFPLHLRDTGLYIAGSMNRVRRTHLAFAPQYPLWSDGADKRRWIHLPPGTFIDASRPDAWEFPRGTRLWKEFGHAGRAIETRFIERRADGAWHYATYVWNEDGSDALLAPANGIAALAVNGAPQGRYDVPSRTDCRACHEGAAAPVLGFSALQLSANRDPNAAHADRSPPSELELRRLVDRGLLRHLPPALLDTAPRIAAASPTERAALGYLHGNCSHCHNHNGTPAPVKLRLAQGVADAPASHDRVLHSLINAPARFRFPGTPNDAVLVAPGDPQASVLALRMRSRHAQHQMPPLGTRLTDDEGLALVERWIQTDLLNRKEPQP